MKDSKKIYLAVLLGSALLCMVAFFILRSNTEPEHIMQVTFFCRESAEEYNKTSLKQGLEQAAKDFGVMLTVQFLNNTGSARELSLLLEKEMENKTDAILVEPVDEKSVLEALQKYKKQVPVVLVNGGFSDTFEFPRISCDHAKLGSDLAVEILKKTIKHQKVLIVGETGRFQDVREASSGIEEGLKGACEVEYLTLYGGDEEKEKQLSRRMDHGDIYAIAALGSRDLEMLGKLKKKEECPDNVLIYGIGKNNQIIADMEDGVIQAIGVCNYYSVGYLSVQEAVQGHVQEKEVTTAIIDKDEIYTPENQRMLFTLVQ